jgi:hypothetical protein
LTFNLACNDYAKYFLALLLLCSGNITASVEDYLYLNSSPSFSSYGTTGLIQMPSARLQEEGSIGVNFSTFYPYQRLSLIAYPFSFLEIQYQYTDIKNKLYRALTLSLIYLMNLTTYLRLQLDSEILAALPCLHQSF